MTRDAELSQASLPAGWHPGPGRQQQEPLLQDAAALDPVLLSSKGPWI